jgi:hypothetical protein
MACHAEQGTTWMSLRAEQRSAPVHAVMGLRGVRSRKIGEVTQA